MDTLLSRLHEAPRELKFGTSGRRGLVADMTQLEVYINALAEIQYLQSLPRAEGGIVRGEEFFYACDLRPSSTCFVPALGGRGELAQAIEQAIRDAGMKPVNLGFIPTPALSDYALTRQRASIMVTGSHIPFDRNGYKTNTACGELRKEDETFIGRFVSDLRRRTYEQPFTESAFDAGGSFKDGHRELMPIEEEARATYKQRYLRFFSQDSLAGLRFVLYQHSAVGRDLLAEVLRELGAEVFCAGRSETFVPIDTENIDAERLEVLNQIAQEAVRQHGRIDALVSTDGDSDRPLLLGVDGEGAVEFFSGDRLGMIVAEFLHADAAVVPISCNDAIDRSSLAKFLEPKTRIGSPYVIAGMKAALMRGKKRVCGWEANGGFLTGSAMERKGQQLSALPTRDALLPLLCALLSARERRVTLRELFASLPARFSSSALLRQFPRATSLAMIAGLSPTRHNIVDVDFGPEGLEAYDAAHAKLSLDAAESQRLEEIRKSLSALFNADRGFGRLQALNYIDGVRMYFSSGDVAHIRPSGNADELRIYAVADEPRRAAAIAALGVREPDGLLRSLATGVAN